MRVAVVIVSDSVARGERQDGSGPALTERCRALGWQVLSYEALSDDRDALEKRLASLADLDSVDLVLTAGGTGIGPRDTTPEATAAVCQSFCPGWASSCGRREARKILAQSFRARWPAFGNALIVNLRRQSARAARWNRSRRAWPKLLPHQRWKFFAALLTASRHQTNGMSAFTWWRYSA